MYKKMAKLRLKGNRMNSDSISEMSGAWFALRVRVRAEYTVAKELEQRGFECFTPGWEDHSNRRGKVTMVAAFPGYLFVRFLLTDILRVLNTPGVQQILGYERPASVDEETINALRIAFASRIRMLPAAYIQRGDKVEVVRGPMRGTTGILVRAKDEYRLVIQIHILQRSVYTEIDADAVVWQGKTSVAA